MDVDKFFLIGDFFRHSEPEFLLIPAFTYPAYVFEHVGLETALMTSEVDFVAVDLKIHYGVQSSIDFFL